MDFCRCHKSSLSLIERKDCFKNRAALNNGVVCGDKTFFVAERDSMKSLRLCVMDLHAEITIWNILAIAKTAVLANTFLGSLLQLEQIFSHTQIPLDDEPPEALPSLEPSSIHPGWVLLCNNYSLNPNK